MDFLDESPLSPHEKAQPSFQAWGSLPRERCGQTLCPSPASRQLATCVSSPQTLKPRAPLSRQPAASLGGASPVTKEPPHLLVSVSSGKAGPHPPGDLRSSSSNQAHLEFSVLEAGEHGLLKHPSVLPVSLLHPDWERHNGLQA